MAPFFSNITFSLIKTYWNIINFVNFCELNNYPYLIFDGINNHIPYEENGERYLSGSHLSGERFLIHTLDLDKEFLPPLTAVSEPRKYTLEDHSKEVTHMYPFYILEDLIDYIKNIRNYYTDNTLHKFVHLTEAYHKGNNGHPNELGAKMWAKHLVEVLEKNYE